MQSTRWVFTINNYEQSDIDKLNDISANLERDAVKYLIFGYEIGDQGTPHIQGFVVVRSKLRLGGIRGLISARGHFECARGTSEQAADYCKKDQNFVEFGVLPGPGRTSQPSVDDFCSWVRERLSGNIPITDRDIGLSFPSLYLRYGGRLFNLALILSPPPELEEAPLNDWQLSLYERLLVEPDDRSIEFYVDAEGGKGKSFFCRWMLSKHPDRVQVLSVGKRDDLAHAIDVSKNIFLFNIPRKQMEYVQYGILESLKDRLIFSPKYASQTKVLFNTPHVIIFSNEHPDDGCMSNDRLIIKEL